MFQTSILRKYLNLLNDQTTQKAYEKFTEIFLNPEKQENIRHSSESQYQEGFCRDLFCLCLGYTINPEPGYNLKTEQRNQTASSDKYDNRKADAAIILNDKVVAVIELKGCDTLDLGKVENQAFGYRAHNPGCRYVIISNFERLRFYIDDASDYLEFNLFSLSYEEFRKLYLVLALEQIRNDIPAKLKAESLTKEKDITTQFYKDYSGFKRRLFENICRNNIASGACPTGNNLSPDSGACPTGNNLSPDSRACPTGNNLSPDSKACPAGNNLSPDSRACPTGNNLSPDNGACPAGNFGDYKLLLFRKTQKLLDRLLFIFFCEDRGLIPANTIAHIIKGWKQLKSLDAYQPLYNRFKLEFAYINGGHDDPDKSLSVFAYNGGLFKPDEVLDNLIIDDEILLETQKLSDYDFESDVSVDILGHIFEHSLTEIEEIQQQIVAERDGIKLDKKKEKTGKRKKDGVFYTPAYITKYIVENTVGRLCEEKKRELHIDDETFSQRGAVAGRKNSKAYKDEIANRKQLDVVLDQYKDWLLSLKICDPACGSGAFLNAALSFLKSEHHLIDTYRAHIYGHTLMFQYVDDQILENNLYGVDINEESVEIAKLSLWLHTAHPGRKLTSLNNNIKCGNSLIDDPAVAGDKAFCWEKEFPEIFANGGFDVVIGNPPYGLRQPSNSTNNELNYYQNKYEVVSYKIDLFHLFFERGLSICSNHSMFGYISSNSYLTNKYIQPLRELLLRDTSIISIINHDEKVFPDPSIDVCTIIASKPYNTSNVISIQKTDIERKFHSIANIIQTDWESKADNSFIVNTMSLSFDGCVPLKELCKSYFGIQAYDRKSSISESANNSEYLPIIDGEDIHPYVYAKPTKYFHFVKTNIKSGGDWSVYSRERIVIRQIGKYPVVGMCHKAILASNTLYSVYPKDGVECNIKYVLCVLNSNLIRYYWSQLYADQKNLFPKIKGFQIDSLPIKKISFDKQNLFIPLADAQLAANEQLQKYTQKFLNRVQTTLGVAKMTEKLNEFYKYDFNVFLSELKKQKIKLSLCDQDEWEEYFNGYRQDCTRLMIEIEENDRQIDRLVYALYGLTEEEIAVVEGK